jgi:hypothetical protein
MLLFCCAHSLLFRQPEEPEEKGRETPTMAERSTEGVTGAAATTGGGQAAQAQLKTADAYFATLARLKADHFGLKPGVAIDKQPIWSAASGAFRSSSAAGQLAERATEL